MYQVIGGVLLLAAVIALNVWNVRHARKMTPEERAADKNHDQECRDSTGF